MLTHIHIWNFAIVERLDLPLEGGLTVLTGEDWRWGIGPTPA